LAADEGKSLSFGEGPASEARNLNSLPTFPGTMIRKVEHP
jgi:hypothetical protein